MVHVCVQFTKLYKRKQQIKLKLTSNNIGILKCIAQIYMYILHMNKEDLSHGHALFIHAIDVPPTYKLCMSPSLRVVGPTAETTRRYRVI